MRKTQFIGLTTVAHRAVEQLALETLRIIAVRRASPLLEQ
jgi:hypothetical protein